MYKNWYKWNAAHDVKHKITDNCTNLKKNNEGQKGLWIGWQWRNFDIFTYASGSGRHVVGQENVNIFEHLGYSQIADLALAI